MANRAGQIVIDISAGTAKFVQEMEAAKGKIREFGREAHGSVSGVQAVSASLRVMEGNMTNNLRAAERFVANTLKLGPILQAAFPIIGAIAFGGVISELAEKLFNFYKGIRDAPEKIGGVFRELNASLHVSNDELRVANDRLSNDIAKLEGKRQNTVALALDEARAAADKLAQSLDRDLSSLDKLMREQAGGGFHQFWAQMFGQAGTRDIAKEIGGETGFGGFRGRISGVTDTGRLQSMYSDEISAIKNALVDAEAFQKNPNGRQAIFNLQGEGGFSGVSGDMTARIESLRGTLAQLREESDSITKQATNAVLTKQKDVLTASTENLQATKPFSDRLKALDAQLAGLREKLSAIGAPESVQVIAKAYGEAQKAIEEVNKALERHHTQLTGEQKDEITAKEVTIAAAEADTEWGTKLAAATSSITDRIRSQQLLTAAIGKGYEATRAANVETRLMQELGQHYQDSSWMQSHQSDVSSLRSGFGREYDAQHADEVAKATQKLREQIDLERELARVQSEGAEVVRQVTLAAKLRQMTVEGATREQIAAEMELYNVQRENAAATDVAKTEEKIDATERLTAATLQGADAVRKATLENRLAEIARDGDIPIPGVIGIGQRGAAAVQEDAADHQHDLADVAVHANRVAQLDQQIAKLTEARALLRDTLAVDIELRDLENQRLQAIVQQTLQLRTASAGVQAFFLEMQEDAKSAANIIYETLNSALDRTSDNLANMLTQKKPKGGWGQAWGKEFQDVGHQAIQSSIKSSLQNSLGKLGSAFGIKPKADGSSEANAMWVRVAGHNILRPNGQDVGDAQHDAIPGGLYGSGTKGGGIFSMLQGLLPKGGVTAGGDADQAAASSGLSGFGGFLKTLAFGGGMAEGGSANPGSAYMVSDSDENEYFIPKTAGTITPAHKMGGDHIEAHYNIDARGAEIGVENRISRIMEQQKHDAIAQSIQANAERARRTPRRGR